jgi:AcrR family transcriptional regulator
MGGMAGSDAVDPSGSRRAQARGLATRARVLEVAARLFVANGYDGTSVAGIAQQAGVGVGTLYHHFPDKRAILLELADDWTASVVAQRRRLALPAAMTAKGREPRELVASWIRATYENEAKVPSLWHVMVDVAQRDPEVAERFRAVQDSGRERIRTLVEAFQAQGAIRPGVDALAAAYIIRDTLERLGTRFLGKRHTGELPERVLAELVEMIGRYLFDGAGTGPAAGAARGRRGDRGAGS